MPEEGPAVGPAREYTGEETLSQLARMAQEHWESAQEALKTADWERYGEEMEQLETVIRQLLENTTDQELPEDLLPNREEPAEEEIQ